MNIVEALDEVISSQELIEVARKRIEDQLVLFRDERLSEPRNNGLVIKEKDGVSSHIIRFGPEVAIRIGLEAIKEYLLKRS